MWDSPVSSSQENPENPVSPSVKTGDAAAPALWGGLAVVCAAACTCVLRKKYRK